MTKPKEPKPDKKPRGRPSTYTQEVADEICARMSEGEPLREICRDERMPPWRTVYAWIDSHSEFDAHIARARKLGHDAIAADCLRIANTPLEGVEYTTDDKGTTEKRADMLGHRKLQIETRLKLLAKWDKRYADKIAVGGDADAPPIRTESTVTITAEEAYKRMLNGG